MREKMVCGVCEHADKSVINASYPPQVKCKRDNKYRFVTATCQYDVCFETRLDKTIEDIAYILDSLCVLRNIYETNNCNECGKKDCEYRPDWGKMVRYNCPFYEEKK